MCGCGDKHQDATTGQAAALDAGASGAGVLSRRGFLSAATVVGAAGAAVLAPVGFAAAAGTSPETRTIAGHFDVGVPDFVYLPVRIPRGVRQLDVAYRVAGSRRWATATRTASRR